MSPVKAAGIFDRYHLYGFKVEPFNVIYGGVALLKCPVIGVVGRRDEQRIAVYLDAFYLVVLSNKILIILM